MNKRPGQVNVTTEVGYCSFCGRPRNLRREDHQLGTLLRSIVTCESCHRTLSSSVGVAQAEPEPAEPPAEEAASPRAGAGEAKPGAKRAPARRTTAKASSPAAKPKKASTTKRATATRPASKKK